MNTFFRILNTFLLAAILATLVGIYTRMPKVPTEPITIQGYTGHPAILGVPVPVTVRIEQD